MTRNSHLRTFKVTHFGINEKPTTDYVLVYNNAGLTSKVSEEIASENAEKNCRCRQLHCRLTLLSSEPPRISAQTLYRQKVESLGYISAADSVSLSSYKFSWWAPKDACFIHCIMAVQGHRRSLILAGRLKTRDWKTQDWKTQEHNLYG